MPSFVVQHPLWHICGLILAGLLVAGERRARSSGILALAIWSMPGVILHELAHLLTGILFRARPTGFSLIPARHGNRWRLGGVRFARITAFNALPVALAPLGLAGVLLCLARNWFTWFAPTLQSTLVFYAVAYYCLSSALPSREDLRIACSWKSILLYSLLATIVWLGFQSALIAFME